MSKEKNTHKEKPKKQAAGKRLNASQREAFKNLTSELYLKGWSYRDIRQEIEDKYNYNLSLTSIARYVESLVNEWRKHRVEKLDDLKTVELQRINKLEETYWDAWQRSMEGATKTVEKQKAVPGKSVDKKGQMQDSMNVAHAEKMKSVEEAYGDPRFLHGIQWCISMRCKILGVEAPIEFKGTMTSEIKRTTVFKTRTRKRQ